MGATWQRLRPSTWWGWIVLPPLWLVVGLLVAAFGLVHLTFAWLHRGTGWVLEKIMEASDIVTDHTTGNT